MVHRCCSRLPHQGFFRNKAFNATFWGDSPNRGGEARRKIMASCSQRCGHGLVARCEREKKSFFSEEKRKISAKKRTYGQPFLCGLQTLFCFADNGFNAAFLGVGVRLFVKKRPGLSISVPPSVSCKNWAWFGKLKRVEFALFSAEVRPLYSPPEWSHHHKQTLTCRIHTPIFWCNWLWDLCSRISGSFDQIVSVNSDQRMATSVFIMPGEYVEHNVFFCPALHAPLLACTAEKS